MSTVTEATLQPGTGYSNERVADQANSNGRKYAIIPAAHSGDDAKLCCLAASGILFLIIFFVVSAVLWGVGASQGSTGMLIAGQVLTGIQIGVYGLAAVVGCCAGCIFKEVM